MRRTSRGIRQTHPLELRAPRHAVSMPRSSLRGADVPSLILVLYALGTLAWMIWRTWPALETLTP